MQIIPLAFFLVMVEFAVGSVLSLFVLDLRNDSSRDFFRLQALINFLLTLLAWATQNGFATPHQLHTDGFFLDNGWLNWQPALLGWFLWLQIPYNISLAAKQWRPAQLLFGSVTALLGVAVLLVDGMGLRPIASAHLGGFFTVAAFMLGALAVGGVTTAMLLGHWYLNTPTASGKPLEFATWLTITGIAVQIGCGLLIGPATYVAPKAVAATSFPAQVSVLQHTVPAAAQPLHPTLTTTPTLTPPTTTTTPPLPVPHGVSFPTWVLIVLQYVLGLGVPLGLSVIALRLERERSFQSATGMLYIAVVFTFFGEILSSGLFLRPLVG